MPISKMAAAGVSAILLSAPGFVHTSSAQTSRPDTCSRTARAAQTACENDVRDNFWTTVGRCLNTSSEVDRTTCIDEARTARTEAGEECAAQFRARIDLCGDVGEAPYDPEFVPANFVNPLEIGRSIAPNRFFPLVPGSTWTYRSKTETVTVEVLGKVEHILGVPCTVVRDIVRQNGKIVEDTIDWHAQQTDGTVWYCGELSQEFEDGELVSLEGSWKAGRDLARPGVIMQAAPHVGDVYRQEFALGDAEDAAQNRSITGSATVPAASCSRNCVVIREFTPLEPDANELKYYAPNIGRILSVDLRTGERLELVRYQIP
jgi:hypothetical protein